MGSTVKDEQILADAALVSTQRSRVQRGARRLIEAPLDLNAAVGLRGVLVEAEAAHDACQRLEGVTDEAMD